MFNMSNNMSNMQFRANTLLDMTNMQNMQNNMQNMHNMQSWFQYVEYALPTLLMNERVYAWPSVSCNSYNRDECRFQVGQPGAKCRGAAFKRPSWPSWGQAASGYPGTFRDDKSHTDISIGILTYTYIGETISLDIQLCALQLAVVISLAQCCFSWMCWKLLWPVSSLRVPQ